MEVLTVEGGEARPTKAMPILLLTSSSLERDVVLGYRLGANG